MLMFWGCTTTKNLNSKTQKQTSIATQVSKESENVKLSSGEAVRSGQTQVVNESKLNQLTNASEELVVINYSKPDSTGNQYKTSEVVKRSNSITILLSDNFNSQQSKHETHVSESKTERTGFGVDSVSIETNTSSEIIKSKKKTTDYTGLLLIIGFSLLLLYISINKKRIVQVIIKTFNKFFK